MNFLQLEQNNQNKSVRLLLDPLSNLAIVVPGGSMTSDIVYRAPTSLTCTLIFIRKSTEVIAAPHNVCKILPNVPTFYTRYSYMGLQNSSNTSLLFSYLNRSVANYFTW